MHSRVETLNGYGLAILIFSVNPTARSWLLLLLLLLLLFPLSFPIAPHPRYGRFLLMTLILNLRLDAMFSFVSVSIFGLLGSIPPQDIAEAVTVSDLVAPEHLEIQTEDAQTVANRCVGVFSVVPR